MLPPLASAWFGAVLAPAVDLTTAAIHVVAIFLAVYTAHVKDGYVDFHVRGEDDDHPMTRRGCVLGLAGAATGFALAVLALWALAGPGAALVTLPTWVIGYLHAPQLDTNPVTATAGYPAGIALAIVGGFYVQVGALAAAPLTFAGVFLFVLAGVKVIDDATDYEYDRSIGKRTVAVALGTDRARRLAYWLMGVGLFAVLPAAIEGVVPPSAALATLAFGSVAILARGAGPKLATMLLIRGAYLFLAALFLSVWLRPLASVPLPDVGVLGPYTYLATEIAFGSLAAVLLAYSGSFRSAARTVAVLYPVAYLWDWYTLTVGVFEIPLRTGVEFLGIPLEEHLFMIVVPALVVGVHESLRTVSRRRTPTGPGDDP
jgi:lycopene cyclase domain-containing protein